jgi:hypothetical protein
MGDVTVSQGAAEREWVVRAERSAGQARGGGQVTVRSDRRPDERSPYARLAGARAWLAVGDDRLRAGDLESALAAGRAGVDELGVGYAPDRVRDDTKLKLIAAEEQLEDGDPEAGAEIVLEVLRTRAALLEQREHGAILP